MWPLNHHLLLSQSLKSRILVALGRSHLKLQQPALASEVSENGFKYP